MPVSITATPVDLALSLAQELAARERDHDLAGTFAAENIALLREAGLFRLIVPEELGGMGAGLAEAVEVLRTLAHGSPSTALMFMMHVSVLSQLLIDAELVPAQHRAFFREQRAWAFGEAMNGRIFGVANSEPGAAGDVHNSRALVTDGRISGLKSFCSMGTNADYYMAAARDEHGTLEYWIVANDPLHVRADSTWNAVGMRSSESVMLRFDGARAIAPLGYPGLVDGFNNRHWAGLNFTAIFVGTAESLLDELRRQNGGVLHQTECVDFHLTIQASLAFVRHCVAVEPRVPDAAYRALVRDCKVFSTRSLAQRASALYIAQGGSAYRFGASASRKFRDLLAGPSVRPPVGMAFDEIWRDLEK
jgi:alkylation response protein AidB-like acyl-CoA dehydrogenase